MATKNKVRRLNEKENLPLARRRSLSHKTPPRRPRAHAPYLEDRALTLYCTQASLDQSPGEIYCNVDDSVRLT